MRSLRLGAQGLSVVLVVGLLALLVWKVSHQVGNSTVAGDLRDGKQPHTPSFTLPRLDGGALASSELEGKAQVVNFWASWCIPCEEEAAVLDQGSRAYKDRAVFIVVNVQDTEPLARDFMRRFGVTYPNGRDATGAIAVEYGMSGVPETYFVDRDGHLSRTWQGALDEARLRSFLDELLK